MRLLAAWGGCRAGVDGDSQPRKQVVPLLGFKTDVGSLLYEPPEGPVVVVEISQKADCYRVGGSVDDLYRVSNADIPLFDDG